MSELNEKRVIETEVCSAVIFQASELVLGEASTVIM